jgi:hypothetical protein
MVVADANIVCRWPEAVTVGSRQEQPRALGATEQPAAPSVAEARGPYFIGP